MRQRGWYPNSEVHHSLPALLRSHDTSNSLGSSAAFEFEVPERMRREHDRSFKFAALVPAKTTC
jgi:hypothetical protein